MHYQPKYSVGKKIVKKPVQNFFQQAWGYFQPLSQIKFWQAFLPKEFSAKYFAGYHYCKDQSHYQDRATTISCLAKPSHLNLKYDMKSLLYMLMTVHYVRYVKKLLQVEGMLLLWITLKKNFFD